jgi:site-specific recombinase XerD
LDLIMKESSLVIASGNGVPAEHVLPELIVREGERAQQRFIEFFTAQIRNPHTRTAYLHAVRQFMAWCDHYGICLETIGPVKVAAYVEQLSAARSVPTVKQHLAAIRHLFDYLVTGQVLPFNPAAAVRGPKYSVRVGKTSVLYEEEARQLLASIETDTVIGRRDLALLSLMTFSFARVGAVVRMRVKDFHVQGHRAWFTLLEKGGKYRQLPAHHKAADAIQAYLEVGGIAQDREGMLFRSTGGRGRGLSERPLYRVDVYRMVKRRAMAADFGDELSCHTFRATGLTNYLMNGGNLETGAELAGHASTRTTQIYDHRRDKVNQAEIERIRI